MFVDLRDKNVQGTAGMLELIAALLLEDKLKPRCTGTSPNKADNDLGLAGSIVDGQPELLEGGLRNNAGPADGLAIALRSVLHEHNGVVDVRNVGRHIRNDIHVGRESPLRGGVTGRIHETGLDEPMVDRIKSLQDDNCKQEVGFRVARQDALAEQRH